MNANTAIGRDIETEISLIFDLLRQGESFLGEVVVLLYQLFLSLPNEQPMLTPEDNAIAETRFVFYHHPDYCHLDFENFFFYGDIV